MDLALLGIRIDCTTSAAAHWPYRCQNHGSNCDGLNTLVFSFKFSEYLRTRMGAWVGPQWSN